MKVLVVQKVISILLNNNCALALSYAQDKVLHVAGKHLLAEKLIPGAFLDGMEMVAEFNLTIYKKLIKLWWEPIVLRNLKKLTKNYKE